MLRGIFWRSLIVGLALLWMFCAAVDVYRIVTEGGLLVWTFGLIHLLFFGVLGLGTFLAVWFVDVEEARRCALECFGEMFSWKNLFHVSSVILAAVLVAGILALLHGLRAG